MAYTKTQWVNGQAPAIDADNLNKIENGIYSNTVKLDSITDYIEEEGTSGIWTYRKWNSGIAECWGSYRYNQSYTWTTWGSIYVTNGETFRQAYPQGLFVSAPVCNLSIDGTMTNAWLLGTTSGTNEYTPYCGFARGSSASNLDVTVVYVAKGRWK